FPKIPHYACHRGRGAIGRSAHLLSFGPIACKTRKEGSCFPRVGRVWVVRDREPQLPGPFPPLEPPEQQQAEVEADDGGPRESRRQWPQPAERALRMSLREEADGRRRLRHGVPRREGRRGRKLLLGGHRAAETLERDAVEDLRAGARPP